MMKEFGGYLPLEVGRITGTYYDRFNPLSFNSARNAILCAIKLGGFERVYLPIYLCATVGDVLSDYKLRYYSINDNFAPDIDEIEDNSVIIIPNYYGVRRNNSEYILKYGNVIFDNTQAFFEEPIKGAYNVYSWRKFFGVTDGAYLISDLPIDYDISILERYQPKYADYLTNAIIFGTNYAYEESLKNEDQLCNEVLERPSILSEMIMSRVDYDFSIRQRKENFQIMDNEFNKINELNISYQQGTVPMVYPLLCGRNDIRRNLVKKQIYVPQWWKVVKENQKASGFEKYLSTYLLPLPIDQRYTKKDMLQMSGIIKKIMKES